MQLPGRLKATTLGDLLGKIHRSRVTGMLALRETEGATAGRKHAIYVRDGLVTCVEMDVAKDDDVPPTVRERPLPAMPREAIVAALDAMFALPDASITFHVSRRAPSSLPPPLSPEEFLHGRPRARDRIRTRRVTEETPQAHHRARALATLGLPEDATLADVHRAFKTLALRLHPDRHPELDVRERAELNASFARAAQAYHLLVA